MSVTLDKVSREVNGVSWIRDVSLTLKRGTLCLLHEPLGNLDYKLREELRTELPRIFEESGAIFVYATTEPSEALLLGGNTICMVEGRALQIGATPQV